MIKPNENSACFDQGATFINYMSTFIAASTPSKPIWAPKSWDVIVARNCDIYLVHFCSEPCLQVAQKCLDPSKLYLRRHIYICIISITVIMIMHCKPFHSWPTRTLAAVIHDRVLGWGNIPHYTCHGIYHCRRCLPLSSREGVCHLTCWSCSAPPPPLRPSTSPPPPPARRKSAEITCRGSKSCHSWRDLQATLSSMQRW